MSAPIFYLVEGELDDVAVGDVVDVQGTEGHHARNVKRLQLTEKIDLSDGEGKRLRGEVVELLDDGLRVKVRQIQSAHAGTEFIVVQALAKNDRDILGIETATELGVSGVIPWFADRSIVRWKKERLPKHHAKWKNTVVAAAKQSRSALIPTVFDLHSSADLAEVFEEDSAVGATVLILHESAEQKLSELLKVQKSELTGPVYIVVGPEGGISPREVELFTSVGAHTVLLGNEVLRSSTAGSSALVVLKTLLGQW